MKLKLFYAALTLTAGSLNAFSGTDVPKEVAKEAIKDVQTTHKNDCPCKDTPPVLNLSAGFSKIAKLVKPAVVNISTTQIETKAEVPEIFQMLPNFPFDQLFKGEMEQKPRRVQSLGSGFIIKVDDKNAFIVTNFHVVEKAKEIKITLNDGSKVDGEVYATDERTDLALLKIDLATLPADKRKLPTLEWGDSSKIQEGDVILTVGNPFNFGGSINMGIISSFSRNIGMQASSFVDNFIQHDAAINPGNSGGPLVNLEGKVIGVNNSIYTRNGGNMGIGFAIPASVAKQTVDQLLKHKRTIRGWLGVYIQKVDDDMAEALGLGKAHGAFVVSVTPGGPAEKANLQVQDIILEFDGKPVEDNSNLSRIVAETPVGKEVILKLWRKGREVTTKIVLGEYEAAVQKGDIATKSGKATPNATGTHTVHGIELSEITIGLREKFHINKDVKGIIVLGVSPKSTAFDLGMRPGDVIMEVTQTPMTKPADFAQAIKEAKAMKRKNVLLWLKRGDNPPLFVPLKITDEDAKSDDITIDLSKVPVIQPPKFEIPDTDTTKDKTDDEKPSEGKSSEDKKDKVDSKKE